MTTTGMEHHLELATGIGEGKAMMKYTSPTTPETRKGSNVALLMSCPARISSTMPTTDTMDVFFTSCTRNPMVGGTATRTACGRMT